MTNQVCLLTQTWQNPRLVLELNLKQWDILIREARSSTLLGRLYFLIESAGLLHMIPDVVRKHLEGGRIVASNEERILSWEVHKIGRAIVSTGFPVVLLKGAAYKLADLLLARGRISSDVDILVPVEKLNIVETALLENGWQHVKIEDYDQYYYRKWSHELPPLRHRERGTVVDVHHTILPPTGRLHPDPNKLLAAAVPLEGTRFSVLAPVDMVLHSAAHAFQDGELRQVLRDLVDLDDFLRHFGSKAEFCSDLIARAEELDLSRPMYHGLRYSKRFLETPIPDFVANVCRRWRPLWPASKIMDWLVENAVAAADPMKRKKIGVRLSLWLLYIRSHWLRMPPWLLARHLLHKLIFRKKKA